jgi:predicted ferric reductase
MLFYYRKNIGWLTIVFFCLVPVLIWLVMSPLAYRFLELNTAMTSIGQVFGLLGITLFSINLILSSRLKIFDRFFWGLNNLYNHHRAIGSISFSLLLFHPILLVVKYLAISTQSAALFFSPYGNMPGIQFGIYALFLMMLLIVITFYAGFKYQNWKLTHKFMVAAFIFAVLHSLYVTSDISRNNFLRYYIFGFAIVGLAAGFYQAFLSRYINRNFIYKINQITRLNDIIVEIKAYTKGETIKYKPGQFVFVSFISEAVSSELHPFSISSSPRDSQFEIVVKSLGDFTETLKNLKLGDVISIQGPYGNFSYRNIPQKEQIWLAGGVGITPFLSMARSLENSGFSIDLYYCTHEIAEAVYMDQLQRIAAGNKSFRMVSWCSADIGRIDAKAVSRMSGGLAEKAILLCGPASFIHDLKEQFLKLNVKRSYIYSEEFKFI